MDKWPNSKWNKSYYKKNRHQTVLVLWTLVRLTNLLVYIVLIIIWLYSDKSSILFCVYFLIDNNRFLKHDIFEDQNR